ncbi:MAG: asparagine synthase (glutamine-hydrolyzing) [Candidatus Magasanikbacteria bacterium CG10_big_fil_rev_8_21_14_0_10_38_6]|uniref:asparagine synthase (glutamine-hydrolyzing) n=1 Tax=Candidatus Magasanikbacteria bacterium CG10_big_fil_rev_8_21_14_0_10_38_6 TaxID=1974647 RepID=A0A2M6P0Q6_9BACT|nr:MAG: asparagine synthase (glutamine-hydrolyzing) [Candidatus Magasanikbacteria bacterium CG10_big_fil_rev_8_21_14_0_10_38_6]
MEKHRRGLFMFWKIFYSSMCGINGFNLPEEATLRKMNTITRHRGPDDEGVFVSQQWSLGHNRLSIIDLSPLGHMPMFTKDKRYCIVYNGELYNFQEIKNELLNKGYTFRSQSDTEVILYAYQEWGTACLQKFNGMFAFAILDRKTEELFIARDRIGIKPLYYYHNNGQFVFSSEIKSLFAHEMIHKEIDYDAMNMYFRMLYIPAPYTIWKHIYKLKPGHFITVKGENVQITAYWSLTVAPDMVNDREYIEHTLKHLLTDSVKKQLISDRPVGVFLSGGIDSSIITGIMSEHSSNVNTFSVGFEKTAESEKYNNDFLVARKTAHYFGTKHHELVLSGEDVLSSLEQAVYHMDEPISNHIQAVNMLLAKYTTDYVKVVLGGDGSDELFGGYERYYYSDVIDRFQRVVPGVLRHNGITKRAFQTMRKSGLYTKINTAPGVERYLDFFAQKESLVASFLLPTYNRTTVLNDFFLDTYFSSVDEGNFTAQFMRTDVQTWLTDESLVRSDKMSMVAGIEQRVPFLDHRLVEFAQRIPIAYKLGTKGVHMNDVGHGYQGKKILVSAMKDYLPQFVLDQPKWGWFSPAAKWLRGPMKELTKEVLSPSYCPATADLFDFVFIETILDDHIASRGYGLNTLWSLITFQLWYKQYIEK